MLHNSKVSAKLVRSTSLVLGLVMSIGIGWNVYSLEKQAKQGLLEQSRILAAQVLALRRVTAENQDKINYSGGQFEFKHLNPAAYVRQVGDEFNSGTKYRIRQVSLKPRVKENMADSYEKKQLEAFARNQSADESWGESTIDGIRYFRYMVPFRVTSTCLPCHGQPKGEMDISGHLKEGYEVGDLIGALTIAIPMETMKTNLNSVLTQNIILTVVAIFFSGAVIVFHTNRFVARPIGGLVRFSQELANGNLEARPDGFKAYGEFRKLINHFAEMAKQLQNIYDQLEVKVQERTAELAAANRELAKISQYKSEFLANMSHELRTPLTAILAFTQDLLARNMGQLTSEQEDYLNDIQESGRQLLGLINDLLDFSKIDSGKMSINLTEVQMGSLATEVEKMLRPLANRKKIRVALKITGEGVVIADAQKMRQVVQNLLGNAIKFTPVGGTVEITMADTKLPEEGSVLVVKDSGPGIPEQARELIFDTFYQVNQGLQKEYRGTGLGLALVKKIVELHLGRIELDSKEGVGSTFTVFIPAFPQLDEELE